jgi:hypothetical protein
MLRLVMIAVGLTACGPRAATVVDERETYVETISDTICDEKQTCDQIGEDGQYEDYEACHDDVEAFMRDWWPADECGDDAIDGDIFLDCDDRARLAACDGGLGDLFEAVTECNAGDVCID